MNPSCFILFFFPSLPSLSSSKRLQLVCFFFFFFSFFLFFSCSSFQGLRNPLLASVPFWSHGLRGWRWVNGRLRWREGAQWFFFPASQSLQKPLSQNRQQPHSGCFLNSLFHGRGWRWREIPLTLRNMKEHFARWSPLIPLPLHTHCQNIDTGWRKVSCISLSCFRHFVLLNYWLCCVCVCVCLDGELGSVSGQCSIFTSFHPKYLWNWSWAGNSVPA